MIYQTFHYQERFIMRTLQQIRDHNKTHCTCLWEKAKHFIRIKTLLAACIHPTSDITGYIKALLFPLRGEKRIFVLIGCQEKGKSSQSNFLTLYFFCLSVSRIITCDYNTRGSASVK